MQYLSPKFQFLITKIKPIKTLVQKFLNLLLKPTWAASSSMSEPIIPTVDLRKPSVPISFPIPTLSDLKSRSYFKSFHFPFNISSVPLPISAVHLPNRRRILVCHDMMGGYVDDKFVQGGSNDCAYAIWHWFLIDVFVYFSHNLVTIPPVCWVNAAHTHGVKVLGTFILEWDEGAVACKTLLSSKESVQLYAQLLVELASALGFDGWLINVEVKRLDREQVTNLKEFVRYLTQTMHTAVPGSLIIWYDSVTNDGHLIYQNELNSKNKPFFDLCDGIFINYFWKNNGPKKSAHYAGNRKNDVYMGIDVFGRKTFGGGQWNTNIALDLLKEDDISAAIFAPGWVYEDLPKSDFRGNQNRWWELVKQSWGIVRSYPKELPFYSNFDQGHGHHFSIKGLKVASGPWNNISCQGFQPLLDEHVNPNQADIKVLINFEDESYIGGDNITCKGSFNSNEFFAARLFSGRLLLEDLPVRISYTAKSDGNSQMGLLLQFTSNSNTNQQIYTLLADDKILYADKLSSKFGNFTHIPIKKETSASWIIHEATVMMKGYTIRDIYIFCYFGNQIKVKAKFEDSLPYCASLGQVSILKYLENIEFPQAQSWAIQFQDISWYYRPCGTRTLSLTITWKLKNPSTQSFKNYYIYAEKLGDQNYTNLEFLGIARVEAFYVSELEIPMDIVGVRFVVQACGLDGNCQKLDESPALVMVLDG